jgi:hypothetical protein
MKVQLLPLVLEERASVFAFSSYSVVQGQHLRSLLDLSTAVQCETHAHCAHAENKC